MLDHDDELPATSYRLPTHLGREVGADDGDGQGDADDAHVGRHRGGQATEGRRGVQVT